MSASMLRRLAVALVRNYPRPWREKYAGEVVELLEASPVRVRDVGELARGLALERARELIESDERPGRTAAILTWMNPLFALTFMAMAWGLGRGLLSLTGPWSEAGADLAGWAVAFSLIEVPLAWSAVWLVRRRRRGPGPSPPSSLPQPPWPPRPPGWVSATGLPVLFILFTLIAWADLSPWDHPHRPDFVVYLDALWWMWMWGYQIGWLSSSFLPGSRMLQALARVAGAENQLKSAERWVEGCHTMIAQGVPSPLNEAQALVDRWTAQHAEALEHLHEVGYRARFE
jgi:hypothetical protein